MFKKKLTSIKVKLKKTKKMEIEKHIFNKTTNIIYNNLDTCIYLLRLDSLGVVEDVVDREGKFK